MADLLGNGGQTLVILAWVGTVTIEAELRFVDLRGDHGDVHEKEDLFKWGLLDVEGGTALECHHFLAFLGLQTFEFGLGELDADVDWVEGQNVGLEDQKIWSFYIGDNGRVVQLDTDMVLLRGILNEVLNLWRRPLGLDQLPPIVFEDICALHGLQHLLKTILLPLSKSIIELNPVGLILLIFRLYLEVILLIDLLEKLTDVVLYLSLLGPQHLLLTLPPVLLFVVLDHKALILDLGDPELSESLLIGLDVVQDRAIFYFVEDGVLIEEIGLFEAQKEEGFMLSVVFLINESGELTSEGV